ncbi:phosphorus acquisition-controlling protein [Ophiostoma piceae UAMH 11346]|uniref:Phosphorus acquisition-controlling protein n=1 Tax=Ophiostoma piceae (strain UAMH 11346) TaxID=1262450 RepID=S3D3E9_OPHP1|nr:phosphorus acquisition-controlling protein [Ophiostoma piceae UAMH 11346]
MAMMGGSAWNGQDQGLHSSSAPVGDDEFQQFLDLNGMGTLADNIQFDFNDGPGAPSHLIHSTSMAPSNDPLATSTPLMPPSQNAGDAITEIDAQIQYLQQQRMQQQQRQIEEQNVAFFTRQNHIVPPTPQSLELQAGTQYFASPDPRSQPQQHQQHPHQAQNIYDRYQHFKDQQDMSFTPLVSPAVTPLETQFSIDTQFTVPGAYFSPLTSPALHAQTDTSAVFDPRLASSASPLDMDLEMPPAATVTTPTTPTSVPPTSSPSASVAPTAALSGSSSGDLAKKARKNNASKARSKANVRQSPITKPMRKKSTTTPIMNAQVLDQLAETLEHESLSSPVILQQQQHPSFGGSRMTGVHMTSSAGTTDSENGSVSPETLTDMPPPPLPTKPRSARPSPYLHPQNSAVGISLNGGGFPSPATPASLMKLASPKQKSHKASPLVTATVNAAHNSSSNSATASAHNTPGTVAANANLANDHIENFELPESLSMDFQKSLPPSSTVTSAPSLDVSLAVTASPSLDPTTTTARMTPSNPFHHPMHSPSLFAKPTGSATHSPQLLPGGTPLLSAARKTPQMLARSSSMSLGNTKKRPSISSVQVSPALRPKISPSIKPLLPGVPGSMGAGMSMSAAEDQASRMLASKSNYQNILEGNTVPGVSYPSELSTNLTSKRTSHKIAEQGRRNRINSALQEIATLLPRPPPDDDAPVGDVGSGGEKGDKSDKGDNDKDKDDRKKDKAGATPNSKASTVELAIDYIKQLKKEVADLTKRAEEAEAKLQQKEEGHRQAEDDLRQAEDEMVA